MVAKNKPVREVLVKHVFNAAREVVFKAWTNPKYVSMWWGPNGFTTPVCELDVRPGGAMRIDMRGPDGTVYPMTGTYQEISSPERLVFTTTPLDEKGQAIFEVLNTVTFVQDGKKTHVTVHARVIKVTPQADMYLQGMEEGWKQTLDRLAQFVNENLE